jgi:hypothetical protein
MKIFEIILEIIGWLQIVAGITLGAGLFAFIVYIKWDSHTSKIIAIIILSIGLLSGVILATRIWIKHGTINWLSRIYKSSN